MPDQSSQHKPDDHRAMTGYLKESGILMNHSKGEIVGHCINMYCPLLYLNPCGFDMTRLKTFPGRTETCRDRTISFNLLTCNLKKNGDSQ